MKRYNKLTKPQQAKAREQALSDLLTAIIEGAVRFKDEANGDDLQARIDTAMETASAMQTPWFAHEYILESCRTELEGMALCDAQDSIYMEQGERCRHLAA